MIEEMYEEYVGMLKELPKLERDLSNFKISMNKLKTDIKNSDNAGMFPVSISAHAYKNISDRLEVVTRNSYVAMSDAMEYNLFTPSNLNAFVINNIHTAINNNSYTKSRSGKNSYEYKYKATLSTWVDIDGKTCDFTAIVENNNVKTGFFNFV